MFLKGIHLVLHKAEETHELPQVDENNECNEDVNISMTARGRL